MAVNDQYPVTIYYRNKEEVLTLNLMYIRSDDGDVVVGPRELGLALLAKIGSGTWRDFVPTEVRFVGIRVTYGNGPESISFEGTTNTGGSSLGRSYPDICTLLMTFQGTANDGLPVNARKQFSVVDALGFNGFNITEAYREGLASAFLTHFQTVEGDSVGNWILGIPHNPNNALIPEPVAVTSIVVNPIPGSRYDRIANVANTGRKPPTVEPIAIPRPARRSRAQRAAAFKAKGLT